MSNGDIRRGSYIGLRGDATITSPRDDNELLQKISQLEEQLEEKDIIIEERNTIIDNLREEFVVTKSECSKIIDNLIAEINSKSQELNKLRSASEEKSRSLSRTQSSMISRGPTFAFDKIEEMEQNLKHTRQCHKELQKRYFTLEKEFILLRDQALDSYTKRVPIICELTDNSLGISQFINTTPNATNSENEEKQEKQEKPEEPKENDNTNGVQLIVELPKGAGTATFVFPASVTVDMAKKAIFHKRLPHLRSNMYMFGLSNSEFLEVEFVKFLEAHESFYDLYSLRQPIHVQLYDKTVSRMLGELDLQSMHLVKNSKEEADFLRSQRRSSNKSQTSRRAAPISRKATIAMESEAKEELTAPTEQSKKEEPKQISRSDSELISVDCIQEVISTETLPYEKLSPDHFPMCVLTSSGLPLIIFVPNDATGDSLSKLLLQELEDTTARLQAKQTIFFYNNAQKDDFLPLFPNDKLIDHISVSVFREEGKIPLSSIGEASIFRPSGPKGNEEQNSPAESETPESPRLSSPRKIMIPQQPTERLTIRMIGRDRCSSEAVVQPTNSLYSRDPLIPILSPAMRTFDRPNREAIPVTFCFEEQTILLNLPRKANIETIKKLVLQKLGKDDNTSSAVRYVLKVTGTSYFIVEGETLLEELSIVKFCQKKGLTTMLSLVTREKSKEDKTISKKVGLILSDDNGEAILNWRMKDTDATDFRIKMSRIIGDVPFQYIPAIFTSSACAIDLPLPEKFKVCVHLGEEGGTGLQDCTTVFIATSDQIARDIVERACKKFRYAANFILIPEEYLLKICGYESYIQSEMRLDEITYVRECLQKKKLISLSIVPHIKVPIREAAAKQAGTSHNSLLVDTPFDTATVDVLGDRETVSLLELKTPFEFKVASVDHLDAIGKKEGDSFYLQAGIYHGGVLVDKKIMISDIASLHSGTVRWRRWMRSSLLLCEVPEDSRVCITLYIKKDSSSSPIANVNASLFDFKDHFRTGTVSLQMWIDGEANPIGTCMENLRAASGTVPIINLTFHSYPMNVSFPHLQPLVNYEATKEPNTENQAKLRVLIDSDPLHRLEDSEKQLIWEYREWLRLYDVPKALVKILLCVQWTSVYQVRETYRLLSLWEPIEPVDALQLLDAQFANRKVREYAVRCLDSLSDSELKDYLLQLVQTLKYEPNHFSPLGVWLLNRALKNQILIGHSFFWHLKSEIHVPEIAERYALLLEMYLRGCGAQRDDLLKQVQVINSLNEVALAIKQVPSSRRKDDLRRRLSELSLPETFQLPLDPLRKASGLIIEKCKSMDSAKAPLWLVFKNADPFGEDIWLIFKSGDDLRQDSLTLQMLGIMDKIWQSEGLDLCLTPYKCIATGDEMGMIETVLESDTTANIQKAAGGVAGALKQTPLANWIKNHNPDGYDQAVENFTRSCAGYCVATYVLGIGDRHNDNIMVNKHGFLFHIDFGHFLGHYKKVLYVRRERAPFVLTPEFANVMGCKGSDNFNKFVSLCTRGYNILRKHANVFINLFAMMLSTGIPELQSENDIEYLRQALVMDLNDEEASKHFTKLIKESLESMSTQLMFVTHIIAHPK